MSRNEQRRGIATVTGSIVDSVAKEINRLIIVLGIPRIASGVFRPHEGGATNPPGRKAPYLLDENLKLLQKKKGTFPTGTVNSMIVLAH